MLRGLNLLFKINIIIWCASLVRASSREPWIIGTKTNRPDAKLLKVDQASRHVAFAPFTNNKVNIRSAIGTRGGHLIVSENAKGRGRLILTSNNIQLKRDNLFDVRNTAYIHDGFNVMVIAHDRLDEEDDEIAVYRSIKSEHVKDRSSFLSLSNLDKTADFIFEIFRQKNENANVAVILFGMVDSNSLAARVYKRAIRLEEDKKLNFQYSHIFRSNFDENKFLFSTAPHGRSLRLECEKKYISTYTCSNHKEARYSARTSGSTNGGHVCFRPKHKNCQKKTKILDKGLMPILINSGNCLFSAFWMNLENQKLDVERVAEALSQYDCHLTSSGTIKKTIRDLLSNAPDVPLVITRMAEVPKNIENPDDFLREYIVDVPRAALNNVYYMSHGRYDIDIHDDKLTLLRHDERLIRTYPADNAVISKVLEDSAHSYAFHINPSKKVYREATVYADAESTVTPRQGSCRVAIVWHSRHLVPKTLIDSLKALTCEDFQDVKIMYATLESIQDQYPKTSIAIAVYLHRRFLPKGHNTEVIRLE